MNGTVNILRKKQSKRPAISELDAQEASDEEKIYDDDDMWKKGW